MDTNQRDSYTIKPEAAADPKESYEYYCKMLCDNASNACTIGVKSLDDLNRMFDAYEAAENAVMRIAEHYPEMINEFAAYLEDESPHVRKMCARGILFYMQPDSALEDKALDVMIKYVRSTKEGEALMWRGYLMDWEKLHGRETGVNDDVSFRKRNMHKNK